jgi:DNA polymerase III sliding clamp (beta) subunit (PCNA family)
MKIKVSDLKEFFKRSNKIKSNGVLPIHDYLLIESTPECVAITKSNGNMYCKHTIEEDNQGTEKLLVEEKRLSALVGNAKGEFIHFNTKGKKVTLKDAANEVKLEAMKEVEVNAFKTFPESEGADRITLNPDVLAALFEARNFSAIVESNFHYVYAHKKEAGHFIYSSNGHLMYLRKFEEELPELVLSPEVCSIVCQFQSVQYYTAGNYDFFDTGATVYGFIKSEYKAPEYMQIIRSINQDEQITMNRAEVISFCELVSSLAVAKFPVLKFEETAEDTLLMQYEESEYNVKTEREVKVKKNLWPETFAFNSGYLTQVLKCFTTEEVNLSANADQKLWCFTHPDEPTLTILIAKVLYLNN